MSGSPSLRTQRLLVMGGLLVLAAGAGIGLFATDRWLEGGDKVGARFGIERTPVPTATPTAGPGGRCPKAA